jgi:TonB family protein
MMQIERNTTTGRKLRRRVARSCAPLLLAWAALGVARGAVAQEQQPTTPVLVPPSLTAPVVPEYPESKRASGESASVLLALELDASGRVSRATVLESAGPEFDAAALSAAERLVFTPATKDGEAVPARIAFRFDFALEAPPAARNAAPTRTPETPAQPAPSFLPETGSTPAAAAPATIAPTAVEAIDIDVTGERPPREPTQRTLEAEEIRTLPGTNGDALRSVTNMPGVARPPGLAGMLVVRGSAPEDTQVFVDGITVPIVYHFGGVSSVVPSEMLERIDFYPGNFSPEYGRAMGGIVDVGLRSPRKDRLGGLLQVDLLDGRVLAEGPVGSSTRFLVGARRSWVDSWLGPVLRQTGAGVTAAPVYYDYQAMIEQDLSRNTTLRLVGYGSDDHMALSINTPDPGDPMGGDLSLRTAFLRGQAELDSRVSDAVRLNSSVAVGRDLQRQVFGSLSLDLDFLSVHGRSDARMRLGRAVTAVAGLDIIWTHYDAGWRLPVMNFATGDTSGPIFGRPPTEVSASSAVLDPGAYAMLELTPTPALKVLPGVRVDYGGGTKRWTADPRLGVRYDINPGPRRTTLKGGIGLFHQPPPPYASIKPFGNDGVRSPSAVHYSLGVEQAFTRALELSVEGFYKDLDDLVVGTPDPEAGATGLHFDNVGTGRSYGAEWLLRLKPEGSLYGWVAYTLSRSERRDGPGQPEVRYTYDQTHVLTALGSYKLGRGWQVGARFRYVTGNPYTPVVGGVMDYDAGSYAAVDQTPANSSRLPAFHQLDLRVDKTWNFEAWRLTAYLDVQNAYNRRNVEAMTYNYNYSKSSSVSGLPILPIIGIKGEL